MLHHDGSQAPGLQLGWRETLLVGHHALMAHGAATQAIRAHTAKPVEIGWSPVGGGMVPLNEKPETIAAAKQATFSPKHKDFWNMAWWVDPVVHGRYPEEALKIFGADAPKPQAGDMALIHQPIDFLGLNVYRSFSGDRDGFEDYPVGKAETSMDWPVTPGALRWMPQFAYERYGLPIVITENGLANNDWIMNDGKVHDPQRIDFLSKYLRELHQAIVNGVDIRGYFHWSLMDNFEWAFGYAKRFGLIHVDYQTQQRTLKDSAYWYREVINSNGSNIL
jgi:beta-glucosidase